MTTLLAILTVTLVAVDDSARPMPSPLAESFARAVIGPKHTLSEAQEYFEKRVPSVPPMSTAADWDAYARRLRQEILEKVVLRGEAAAWARAQTKVEWLETLEGGPGYRIKKFRYEALPGLWIPALLYEPTTLQGKVPAVLNVNGHDGAGKAAGYKQLRCINLAKRGMLAYNFEWLGMGQLNGSGFVHYRMNQLDLCGTSGLAPFYLALRRGLDVVRQHPNVDPERVAMTGLSGGGWQTIFFSALEPRITLAVPVAGYSSFLTRVRNFKDLGDSEQTPCDLATVADYKHLTALMAPRPTLLTFCAKDNCCFEAGYALPPLQEAAEPVFRLYGKPGNLRTHINVDPGTHNYEVDNRQALYKMLGDHFYAGVKEYSAKEIPSEGEVRKPEALHVALPNDNLDFHKLALRLSAPLPRQAAVPSDRASIREWQAAARTRLRAVVKPHSYRVSATPAWNEERQGTKITSFRLKLDDAWTLPAVEVVREQPKGTVILVVDGGKAKAVKQAESLLESGFRVVVVDPLFIGEAQVGVRDSLFGLVFGTVGERPLGLQASQLAAVCRWCRTQRPNEPVTLSAEGPRSSLSALVAAAIETEAISALELRGCLGSLKEILERDWTFEAGSEYFCFGLLEHFDIKQLVALVAPRPVRFHEPSARLKGELAEQKSWSASEGGHLHGIN